MDDDGHVVLIEQPDGAMLATPFRVARNGGAGRVRSNAEGSKSASASVRSGKFKKQRRAPEKYVRPKEWQLVRRYNLKSCYGARFDSEGTKIDMYQKARTLMELRGQKMLPDQDELPNGLHLWTFKRQANVASNGVTIREYQCPLRFICNCRVGLRTVEGIRYTQLERRGMHHIKSHPNHRLYPVRAGSWTIFPGRSFGETAHNKLNNVVED